VTLKTDGALIGGVGLRTKPPEVRVADLGIALYDKQVWGRGYGTDTMRTVCRFGFDEMDLARIELWVEEGNDVARHVYEKVGFVHEGTAREAWYKRGQRLHMHLYGLLRGELR
jgi:RimJ/RimL family protein N-acetyltransferase